MSLDISFHNHGLVEVRAIGEDLATLDIYDNPDHALGSRVIMYFNSPIEIAAFASKVAKLALAANAGRKVEV